MFLQAGRMRSISSISCATLEQEAKQVMTVPDVYLAGVVGVDFDGQCEMYQHFIQHYHLHLQVPKEKMLLVLNSNRQNETMLAHTAKTLQDLTGVRPAAVWSGSFEPREKSRLRNTLIAQHVPLDAWIINVDLDEFHWFGLSSKSSPTAGQIAAIAEQFGYLSIKGTLIDRASASGMLNAVQPPPQSIWDQFPLLCRATQYISHAALRKVMMMHGSARTMPGYHYTQPPVRTQKALFEHGLLRTECQAFAQSKVSHQGCNNATLYGLYSGGHWKPVGRNEAMVKKASAIHVTGPPAGVHHFKFTAAVIPISRERMQHYRGDDLPAGSSPRYAYWPESARTYNEVRKGSIDLRKAGCVRVDNQPVGSSN